MEISVLSKRCLNGQMPGSFREYVGRPSPLGNPFVIGKDGDRGTVVLKYRKWFYSQLCNPDIKKLLRDWGNKAARGKLELVCWCAPLACHADVIREFLLLDGEIYIICPDSQNFLPPDVYDRVRGHFFKIDHSYSSKYPEGRENEWSESFWLSCLDDPAILLGSYIDYDFITPFDL